ncbi:hypothetical protein L917_18637 [Phytophthora nicotianae]|uniref:Uncharacterized protein n=1 Tax=Phytophthora nicotianae TaxID=4792 RepID=W2K720_PHYNI|nr:hypothetical protein L917_18637 [Phytophthora nicotianae]
MSEAWEFTTRNDHSATSKQTIVVILGAAQRSQSIAPDLDDRLDCFVENLRRRAQLTRTNDERVRSVTDALPFAGCGRTSGTM